MNNDPCDSTVAAPKEAPADENADTIGAELIRLKRDLAQVQLEFNSTHAVQLLQANEQLVLAALKAEAIAEAAMTKLRDLTRSAQRDALTDTPNRALMLDRLQTAIAMAKRRETHVALLLVALDHLKDINDTQGHLAGDGVLQHVARRLESSVRASDTVSRHSGDKFLVLLAEISEASDAALIAAKMLSAIATLPQVGTKQFAVSASIGIAIYPEDGIDAATLIDRADAAMSRAKKKGGSSFQFHSAGVSPDNIVEQSLNTAPPNARGKTLPKSVPYDIGILRDANEQLMLSSLTAHEAEEHARQAHLRQSEFLEIVAELLNQAHTDQQQHKQLQLMVKGQVTHMAKLVDDLLNGMHININKPDPAYVTVDLSCILNLAMEACQPAVDVKQQYLRAQIPKGPLPVQGNPSQLTQIFRSLLDFASRHTQEGGGIALSALVLHRSVVTSVCNNGIGISAEALPHIFDPLVKSRTADVEQSYEPHIDLAVVHDLVEAHGGSIGATSAGRDLGSEFFVSLPLKVEI